MTNVAAFAVEYSCGSISLSPRSGDTGSKDLQFLRYYNVQEWENYVKALLYLQGVELRGSEDLPLLRYYNAQEWESRLTSVLNTAKNNDFNRKCIKQKLRRIKFLTKTH